MQTSNLRSGRPQIFHRLFIAVGERAVEGFIGEQHGIGIGHMYVLARTAVDLGILLRRRLF
jgi:hypothetical protein